MSNELANTDPRQLRRDVRSVVLCVVAFIITMNIVSVIVITVAVFFEDFDLIMSYVQNSDVTDVQAIDEELSGMIMAASTEYAGLGSILGMLCGLPWFFLIRGKNFLTKDVTKMNSKAAFGTLGLLLICIFGVQFFMSLIYVVLEPLFNQGGSSLTDVLEEATSSLALSPTGALYVVIIGPICEELVFRGAVMRKLERYGANFAIVISSLLFGLYHIILFQAVFAFFIGLILAYVAGRFSLKWAIILHMINNGLSVLIVFLNSEAFSIGLNLVYMVSLVAVFVILIVGRKYLIAQKKAGAPSEPRVFARAFCSPWLIVYILLCVLGGTQMMSML